MADLYDYYHAGDNTHEYVWTIYWRAQSFTASAAYKIKSVKLKLFRVGSPGMIYVKIRATSGGLPVHPDLCVGETNGNTLPISSGAAEWREIFLGAGSDLASGLMYATVMNVPGGSGSVYICWRGTNWEGYPPGTNLRSNNNDASWYKNYDKEELFETWGEEIVAPAAPGETAKDLVQAGFI